MLVEKVSSRCLRLYVIFSHKHLSSFTHKTTPKWFHPETYNDSEYHFKWGKCKNLNRNSCCTGLPICFCQPFQSSRGPTGTKIDLTQNLFYNQKRFCIISLYAYKIIFLSDQFWAHKSLWKTKKAGKNIMGNPVVSIIKQTLHF